jgi:hypothetical protein
LARCASWRSNMSSCSSLSITHARTSGRPWGHHLRCRGVQCEALAGPASPARQRKSF